jgi:acyl carrier protein
MLTMEMGLEDDLGIDSIKRVEILSEMSNRSPGLPEVDTSVMAGLRTLGEIVAYMREQTGGSAPPPTEPEASSPAPRGPGIDLEKLLLEVVAETTGYPADMLTMEMGLEDDLGIDSIKRVEILSEMSNRAPDLPEVDTAVMAGLRTLGQIVDYMREQTGAPAAAAAPAPAASPGIDLEKLLLDVVAETTGYPADMLTMEMGLEDDLGIDSIKRVEILSEMSNRAPDLPEVDTAVMAGLRTLGQIVEYMRSQTGGPPDDTPPGSGVPAQKTEAGNGTSAARHVVKGVAAPAAGFRDARLSGSLVVTGGDRSLCDALASSLAREGLEARALPAAEVPAETRGVIYLGGLSDEADTDSILREGFRLARAVAGAVSEGGVFITVQDTGGDFGVKGAGARAVLGGLAALAKTASVEWPKALVRALDVERAGRPAQMLAAVIAGELLRGGAELEIGLDASGRRTTLIAETRPTRAGSLTLDDKSVVVASGGARGVTARCLVELAKETKASFLLLGRTPLVDEPEAAKGASDDAALKRALLDDARAKGTMVKPAELGGQVRSILSGREVRETLKQIEAAGGRARYAAVSVTDADALGDELKRARAEWGPIHGIVHGAGVLADKRIEEKTDDQFDRVYDTKVQGLRALLTATADDPLRAICLFSSVAARVGNNGQVDYAMANEVLNKVARAEAARRDGCVVRSLGWGPWEGGMVTPALKAHFTAMGVSLITLDDGARALVDELRDGEPDAVEVVIGAAPRAAALAPDAAAAGCALDLRIDRASHPWLADHSIRNVPVVPVVLAVEWMSRAARSWRPDRVVNAIKDVKVRKGIELGGFDNGGDQLRVVLRAEGEDIVAEIRGKGDVLHYTATLDLSASGGDAPAAPSPSLSTYQDTVYGDVLFHGPAFQVIEGVDGIGDEGIRARLAGVTSRGWGEGWRTDAAALDGGLQMALLWDKHLLGGSFLPTSIGSYRAFVDAPVDGPIEAVLTGRAEGKNKTRSDILFTAGGKAIAELRDVETHRIPS